MMNIYRIAQVVAIIFLIIILTMAIATADFMSFINFILISIFFYFVFKNWKKKIKIAMNTKETTEKNSDTPPINNN